MEPSKSITDIRKMMGVHNMKDICNICSWEYDEECGHEVCALSQDNKWEDIPKEFKELLPSSSRE